MRLNKFLATSVLASLAATALAQFGVYGDNNVLNSGFRGTGGVATYPLRIRMDVPSTVPGAPINGGGNFRIVYDPRYIDIRVRNTVTGAVDTINNIVRNAPLDPNATNPINLTVWFAKGLVAGTNTPLAGVLAAGLVKRTPTVYDFLIATLSTAVSDLNEGPAEPYVRTGTIPQGRPLPELIVNWDAICRDFGLFNTYQVRSPRLPNDPNTPASFVWGLTPDFQSFNTYFVEVNGLDFTCIPEPASMIALGSGLVGLLALRRRKK